MIGKTATPAVAQNKKGAALPVYHLAVRESIEGPAVKGAVVTSRDGNLKAKPPTTSLGIHKDRINTQSTASAISVGGRGR